MGLGDTRGNQNPNSNEGWYIPGTYLLMYIHDPACHWTKNQTTPQCWWCRYRTQTRDTRSGNRGRTSGRQRLRRRQGGGKTGGGSETSLADERCGRAVLDFLSTTDVGRRVPVGEEDAVSAVSELEVRE